MNPQPSIWFCVNCYCWIPSTRACPSCQSEKQTSPTGSQILSREERAHRAFAEGRVSLTLRLLCSNGLVSGKNLALLAKAYQQQKRWPETVLTLERLLKEEKTAKLTLELATAYSCNREASKALALIETIPENLDALVLRARIFLGFSPEESKTAALKIEEDAKTHSYPASLCQLAAKLWAKAAKYSEEEERIKEYWSKAESFYKRYMEQVPLTLDVVLDYPELLEKSNLESTSSTEVLRLLDSVKKEGEKEIFWHMAYIRTLLAANEPVKAKEAGEIAVSLFSQNSDLVALSQLASQEAWKQKRAEMLAKNNSSPSRETQNSSSIRLVKEKLLQTIENESPPKGAPSFLFDLKTLLTRGEQKPVKERPKLQREVLEVLCRSDRANAVITGPPGSGKSALLRAVAKQIVAKEDLPSLFEGYWPFELDPISLVGGTQTVGSLEERLSSLSKFCESNKIILFIDDFHLILGAGSYRNRPAGLETLLQPLMSKGNVKLVGATNDESYEEIRRTAGLERRLTRIKMPAMNIEETTELLEWMKLRLEQHYERILPDSLLGLTARMADHHIKNRALPDSAIDLLERASAKALMEGKEEVLREQLLHALADILRIPIDQIHLDQMSRLLAMETLLAKRVLGQEHAIQTLADIVRMSKAELDLRSHRPDGVFLFVGATGVGKTELAIGLAEILSTDENSFVRLDMSEFSEPHTASRLFGASPGYVGYEQQGQLTGALRLYPSAVVLLDEIEKAHPKIYDLFLQIFDAGRITDGRGQVVDCSRASFVMTSNLGTSELTSSKIGFQNKINYSDRVRIVNNALSKHFRPEFLNRIDAVVVFDALSKEVLHQIIRQKLDLLTSRFHSRGFSLELSEELISLIEKRLDPDRTGARGVIRAIEQVVAVPLSRRVLEDQTPRTIKVFLEGGEVRIVS